MIKRHLYFLFLVVILNSPVSMAYDVITWNGAGADTDWFTDQNWIIYNVANPAWPPTSEDWALIDISAAGTRPQPVISDGDAVCSVISISHYGTANGFLTMSGGTLTVGSTIILGWTKNDSDPEGSIGTLNMDGGHIEITGARNGVSLRVGFGGIGIVNMTGGTITLADDLVVGSWTGLSHNSCHIYMSGGTIYAPVLQIALQTDSQGGNLNSIDFSGDGKIVLDGDVAQTMLSYVADDRITGYGDPSDDLVVVTYDSDSNTTIIEASDCPLPLTADITGDCAVNILDLVEVVRTWLECGRQPEVFCL